jgi:hypothetical protein
MLFYVRQKYIKIFYSLDTLTDIQTLNMALEIRVKQSLLYGLDS